MRLLGMIVQTLGFECVVLGFVSSMAELWAEHEVKGDKEAPPHLLVEMAHLARTLTHASPLVALTALGVLLIVLGAVLHRLGAGERNKVT